MVRNVILISNNQKILLMYLFCKHEPEKTSVFLSKPVQEEYEL